MSTYTRIIAPLVLASGLALSPAAAQTGSTHLGFGLVHEFDIQDPALTAHLDVPVSSDLALYPSAALYLVDQGTRYALNADVKYDLALPFYVGGGFNVLRRTTTGTDAGVNLIGGLEENSGRFHLFAEGRVILNDGSAFQAGVGVAITLR